MRTSKRERERIYNACYGHEGVIDPSDKIDLEEVRRLTEDAEFADAVLALLQEMRRSTQDIHQYGDCVQCDEQWWDRIDALLYQARIDALLEREG